MSAKAHKLGVVTLKGPAVDRFDSLRDDNDAEIADAETALKNFRGVATDFFSVHREFLDMAEDLTINSSYK